MNVYEVKLVVQCEKKDALDLYTTDGLARLMIYGNKTILVDGVRELKERA